jgi:endoglucanase
MNRFIALALALAALVLGAGMGAGRSAPARGEFLFAVAPPVGAACRRLAADHPAWQFYRARFVTAEGRVVDNANGGVSHSEGQGYGLLLAAAFRDEATFRRILGWTRAELGLREDGLFAWRWTPAEPHVADGNNATDGDLLIAWALAEAHDRWGDPSHLAEARDLARAIFEKATIELRGERLLMPAVAGFGAGDRPDGPVVNPSYWVFPALERLASASPEQDWAGLTRSGLRLLQRSRFGPAGLPPEWLAVKDEAALPAEGFPRVFGYNAIRIPLYLAMMRFPPTAILRPYPALAAAREGAGPAVIDLETGGAVEPLSSRGYRQALRAAHRLVRPLHPLPDARPQRDGLYYPATLGLLSDVLFHERSWQCL